MASFVGKKEVVQLLMNTVDINAKNNEGESALDLAIRRGDVDIIKSLLEVKLLNKGNEPNVYHNAFNLKEDRDDIVDILIKNGFILPLDQAPDLFVDLVLFGQIKILKKLFQMPNYAKLNYYGPPLLFYALATNHINEEKKIELAQFLLNENCCDLDYFNTSSNENIETMVVKLNNKKLTSLFLQKKMEKRDMQNLGNEK